jgi:bacterioferritin-associated ferredoxin
VRQKTFLCLCHDVTADDVEQAVRAGYTDPETVKRFTAAFMGPCQGKWCATLIMREIARCTGVPADDADTPSARPPVFGVRLGALASSFPPMEEE